MLTNLIRRHFFQGFVILMSLLFFSCSQYMFVKPADYPSLANSRARIQVHTTSGDVIQTEHYMISGDTLIITEPDQLFYKGLKTKISFSEIKEIRDIEHSKLTFFGKITLGIAAIPVVAIMALVIAIAIYGDPFAFN